jgi:hypothetical protein
MTIDKINGTHSVAVLATATSNVKITNLKGELVDSKDGNWAPEPYRGVAAWQNENLSITNMEVTQDVASPVIQLESHERGFNVDGLLVHWRPATQVLTRTATNPPTTPSGNYTLTINRPTGGPVTTGPIAYGADYLAVLTAINTAAPGLAERVAGGAVGKQDLQIRFAPGVKIASVNSTVQNGTVTVSDYTVVGEVVHGMAGSNASSIDHVTVDNVGYGKATLNVAIQNSTAVFKDVTVNGGIESFPLPGRTGPTTLETLHLPDPTQPGPNRPMVTWSVGSAMTVTQTIDLLPGVVNMPRLSLPAGRYRRLSIQLINDSGTPVTSTWVPVVIYGVTIDGVEKPDNFVTHDGEDVDSLPDAFQTSSAVGATPWTGKRVDMDINYADVATLNKLFTRSPADPKWLDVQFLSIPAQETHVHLLITYEYLQ